MLQAEGQRGQNVGRERTVQWENQLGSGAAGMERIRAVWQKTRKTWLDFEDILCLKHSGIWTLT